MVKSPNSTNSKQRKRLSHITKIPIYQGKKSILLTPQMENLTSGRVAVLWLSHWFTFLCGVGLNHPAFLLASIPDPFYILVYFWLQGICDVKLQRYKCCLTSDHPECTTPESNTVSYPVHSIFKGKHKQISKAMTLQWGFSPFSKKMKIFPPSFAHPEKFRIWGMRVPINLKLSPLHHTPRKNL